MGNLEDTPTNIVQPHPAECGIGKLQDDNLEITTPPSFPSHSWPRGWRITVLGGSLAAAITLLINIVVLVWTSTHFKVSGGVALVFSGSCSKAKSISVWSHLGINIVSTVLLAASNGCMQVLVAPTRSEVDAAHKRWKWLDLGTQTVRNMRHIRGGRILLWALLGLSSVPLHLLYNSVVVEASNANMFNIITVTEDFMNGTQWNPNQFACRTSGWDGAYILPMQHNATTNQYVRLEPEECINTYVHAQSKYANVILVTKEKADSSLVYVQEYEGGGSDLDSNRWVCDRLASNQRGGCDVTALLADFRANGWKSPGVQHLRNNTEPLTDPGACAMDADHMFLVDHCLAMPTTDECSIFVGVPLLAAVAVCNFIKLACMLATLIGVKFKPIITIGDAVESFLRQRDETTTGFGMLEAKGVAEWAKQKTEGVPPPAKPWKKESKRGISGISGRRWICCNIAFLLFIAIACFLLYEALDSTRAVGFQTSFKGLSTLGLGKGVPEQTLNISFYDMSISQGMLICAIVANIPQLIISVLYLLYNDLFTRMAIALEWASFYREDGSKVQLRVSRPSGMQRSTSFLQLPIWWAIPVMALMTCLHWMVSQSIFFSLERLRDYGSFPSDTVKIGGVAWSPLGIIISTIIGVAMVLALWFAAAFIKLPGGIPVVRSCSAAISAACWRPEWDGDAAEKLLSWGVVDHSDGVERIGFSSMETGPLREGVVYSN